MEQNITIIEVNYLTVSLHGVNIILSLHNVNIKGMIMVFQQISESELILMKIIWRNGGSALYAVIMEELEKENTIWKKNTVLTLLSRLMEKGFLRANKIGRRNEYTALVSEEQYQAIQTKSFVNKVYEGNVKGLVSTLIQQDILSSNELKELEKFWRKKKNE